MASIFYSRYVPPTSKGTETKVEQRPPKKRKKTASSVAALSPESHGFAKPRSDILQEPLLAKEDKAIMDDQDLPLRNRHQKIYSKYEKAKQNAAEKSEKVAPPEDKKEVVSSDPVEIDSHGLEPLPQPAQVIKTLKVSMSSALPDWLRSPTWVCSEDAVPFESLPIKRETVSLLKEKGYQNAFAIQSAMLPMLLPGPQHFTGDLCISAATGSGKTIAYTLPMLDSLGGKPLTRLRGLVVVPTRELVNQVKETMESISGKSGVKIGTAVGSKTLKEEQLSLIAKNQRYDPEAYKAEQERTVSEDEELLDWDFEKRFGPKDDFELLYNHVIEYNSKVDVLICTPGRLVEHVQSTTGFTLEHVQWLVIDEADRLLDESFQQWVDAVLPGLEYLPPLDPIQERLSTTFHMLCRRNVRKIVLSATMTRDISRLTALRLRRPRLVVLGGQSQDETGKGDDVTMTESGDRIELPRTLQEVGVKVIGTNEKPLYLVKLLESDLRLNFENSIDNGEAVSDALDEEDTSENSNSSASSSHITYKTPTILRDKAPIDTVGRSPTHGTLIFTKTNEHASRLARLLSLLRPAWATKIATLTKSTSSSKGLKIISAFRKRKLLILIASDRASRGLDIPDLARVVNYDMPPSLTSYIHRVGRTARAGMEGKATTLIADSEARWFWNEIARSDNVGRGPGIKVQRANMKLEIGDEGRKRYEEALKTLGDETRGIRKVRGA